jgi:DNA mismatch endonuclease, patch repair protein
MGESNRQRDGTRVTSRVAPRNRNSKPARSQQLPTRHSRLTPSFDGLRPASRVSSRIKQLNRNADTSHERQLRSALWKRGLRFRKNVRSLPGKPDIVFRKARLVVFCDGDFWHGRHWRKLSRKLRTGTNASYWLLKIRANMQRDRRHTLELAGAGWRVLRLWETDILKNPDASAALVEVAVRGPSLPTCPE